MDAINDSFEMQLPAALSIREQERLARNVAESNRNSQQEYVGKRLAAAEELAGFGLSLPTISLLLSFEYDGARKLGVRRAKVAAKK